MIKKIEKTQEFDVQPSNGARDLMSKLYREIGIPALAAALEINKNSDKIEPKPIKKFSPDREWDDEAA